MIRNVNKLLNKTKDKKGQTAQDNQDSKPQDKLRDQFDQNVELFRSIYDKCFDVVFRPFLLFGKTRAMLIYIEGLSDTKSLDEFVFYPLMQEPAEEPQSKIIYLEKQLPVSKVKMVNTVADCIDSISSGHPILLYDGGSEGFSLGLAKWEKRAIEEPTAEVGIRGPREGFVETLEVNTSQLRRIIKSPALKIQSMNIGSYTKTTVAIAYIDGIVDKTLIEEITNRLNRINIDGILDSGYIEELIEDNPHSPFPQILSTERPDVACSNLLEGRAVILVAGTPVTLIAPISFFSLIQQPEDYYQRFMIGTFLRWLRFVFIVVSLLLPSLYVAVLTYHHEAIPTALLLSISASRETVPFPAIIEVLLMEVFFEALREAGVRLPKQVGSAVSIVGALVIGQASVQAGLVSAPMVIVVAITGIASMMTRYVAALSFRMLRFPMVMLAGTLGLLGVMMGIIFIVIHLCSLRSFGVPYLTPLAPLKGRELKDVLWRSPWWMMNTRPHLTGTTNLNRQALDQAPNPKSGGDPG